VIKAVFPVYVLIMIVPLVFQVRGQASLRQLALILMIFVVRVLTRID
jgi:hypothetical protein